MKRIKVEEINGIIYIDGMDIMKTIGEISKEADRLKAKNQKQKKVIDKAIEYIEKFIPIDEDTILMRKIQRDYLLDILKEVEQ